MDRALPQASPDDANALPRTGSNDATKPTVSEEAAASPLLRALVARFLTRDPATDATGRDANPD